MKKISRKSFLKLASAAAMSGITAGALAACNAASGSTAASSAAAKYTPGTYTATAKGMSDITMTATFSETAITDIQLDLSGETDSIGQAAKDDLIKQLLEAQNRHHRRRVRCNHYQRCCEAVHERLHHTGHGRHGSVCPGSF